MTDLDALLAGIVANPHEPLRWLIVADWLDDHGQPERAELLRLHRELIRTCCEPDAHPERSAWQARIVELIDQGVKPCVPQHTLMLPGGVPLVSNFIPPGTFLMGSEDGEANERPVHKVTLTKGFFMGIYPVTENQWFAVMRKGRFLSSVRPPEEPVTELCWGDVIAFCNRLAKRTNCAVRLPTEAEWEFACRAGTTTRFHYGDHAKPERMNYLSPNRQEVKEGDATVRPGWVGSFVANAWGLYDCNGTVAEWCADWYEEKFYAHSPPIDPTPRERTKGLRVTRGGGCYFDDSASRSAARGCRHPGQSGTGFRVVFTLS